MTACPPRQGQALLGGAAPVRARPQGACPLLCVPLQARMLCDERCATGLC